jgi:hypothetical protein
MHRCCRIRALFTCALVALVSVMLVSSCKNPSGSDGDRYILNLSCFPEDVANYTLRVQTFKVRDAGSSLTGNFNLGTVSPTSTVEKSISVDSGSTHIGIYLESADGNPRYFRSFSLAGLTDKKLTLVYWLDYSLYFTYNTIRFGLNRTYLQPLSLGQSMALDYSDAPFYLYETDKAKAETFRFTISNPTGSSVVRTSDTFAILARYSGAGVLNLPSNTADVVSSGDSLFIAVAPQDYSVTTKLTLKVEDVTADLAFAKTQSFSVTNAASFDEQNLYLANQTYDARLPDLRCVLKKWNVATGAVQDVKTFDSPITAIVRDGSLLYIGSGKQLYSFDPATDTATLRTSFPGTVSSISPAGDFLIVYGSSGTFSLVSKSDYSVLSTKTGVLSPGKMSVYIQSQNRVYLYDGEYSGNICYQEFDPVAKTLGTYGYGQYFNKYSLPYPLKQFGTDLKLIAGSGLIFSINDSSASKIKYDGSLGRSFTDILFLSDRILLLVDADSGCSLVSLSPTSPYAQIASSTPYAGESGIQLVQTSTGAIMVSKETSGRIRVRKFDAAALPGAAAADVSREESRSETWTHRGAKRGIGGEAGLRLIR